MLQAPQNGDTKSQPARMRCGKDRRREVRKKSDLVATRTNALWQSVNRRFVQHRKDASQPARMRCGKAPSGCRKLFAHWSQPARMRCGKVKRMYISSSSGSSQPARMRCGKVAPLLCPNQKPREHELRSSFLVSPSVILAVTFYYDSTAFETFQHLYSKNRRIKTVRCGGVFF